MPNFVTHLQSNFVILNRSLLDNPEISLELKGFIAWALSRPPNWKYNTNHIQKALGIGRDKVYSLYRAAEKLGYLTRMQIKNAKHQWGETIYVFHDKSADPEEIKKMFPFTDLPYTENQEHNKNRANSLDKSKELNKKDLSPRTRKPKPKPEKAKESNPPSASLGVMRDKLFSFLQKHHPKKKLPKSEDVFTDFERLMRIDGQSEEDILALLDWIMEENDFWSSTIQSSSGFRRNFLSAQSRMNLEKKQSRVEQNRKTAKQWKRDYPNQYRSLEINSSCVVNPQKGKDLSLDMDPQEFANRLEHLADGINV